MTSSDHAPLISVRRIPQPYHFSIFVNKAGYLLRTYLSQRCLNVELTPWPLIHAQCTKYVFVHTLFFDDIIISASCGLVQIWSASNLRERERSRGRSNFWVSQAESRRRLNTGRIFFCAGNCERWGCCWPGRGPDNVCTLSSLPTYLARLAAFEAWTDDETFIYGRLGIAKDNECIQSSFAW